MPVSILGNSGIQFPDNSLQTAAASPFVLKNRIINGDMRIDQRNAGAILTVTSSGQKYPVDRFYSENPTDGTFTVQQSSTAPAGFNNSYVATVTVADTNLTTTQFAAIAHQIEGYNVADMNFGTANAKTFTLSFWVQSSVTGTFGGSFRNSADNRCYPFTYTISAANTWEQKTITVAGDTTGTWLTTNGIGLKVWFSLGAGPTYSGPANAWASSLYVSATGATNLLATNGATFYITGVQLEIGTSATPFERRLYNQELANCQRYYWQQNSETTYAGVASGLMNSTTAARVTLRYPQPMRTIPTISVTSVGSFIVNQGSDLTPTSITAWPNSLSTLIDFNVSGGTLGRGVTLIFNNTSSGSIQASAEL